MNSVPPRRIIRSFDDFIAIHSDHSPIFYCRGKLSAGYDLLIDLRYRYRFESPEVLRAVEKAIGVNRDLFEVWPRHDFFRRGPAGSSFSGEFNLPGELLFVRKGRRTKP